jgi:Protein of unknown function (DUF3179)
MNLPAAGARFFGRRLTQIFSYLSWMKLLLFLAGVLLLFATEILRVYFIMPFLGSQHNNTIGLAYFIDHNRVWLRLIGIALISYPLYHYWRGNRQRSVSRGSQQGNASHSRGSQQGNASHNPQHGPGPKRGRLVPRLALSVLILFYGLIFFFFNFRFEADKMFYQPANKTFAAAASNKIPLDRLVIGVVINNEAKAYPIQVIGYHHQVRDTLGNTPVMITYCTVCRTGRVFLPLVHGSPEDFRLVGMDHFNAMFEDARTKSWWQQATGTSIAGPLKNAQLTEIPSR